MNSPELYVFEYGGTARSGKGTIVSWLSEVHPEVATDETGADYRAVALGLLLSSELEVDMSEAAIHAVVGKLSINSITDLVAQRKEIEDEAKKDPNYDKKDPLHSEHVSLVVPHVSPFDSVRKAVKKGFAERVSAVRDDEEHRILLVDGRNLGPVIEGIPGTTLVLRSFVYCMAMEAARRECLRDGLTPDTPRWHEAFSKHHEGIVNRNNIDKNRPVDAVVPDSNAIKYWTSQDLIDATVDVYGHYLFKNDRMQATQTIFSRDRDYTDIPRIGAGFKAVAEQRQVHFDTTPFASYSNSKHAMLLAANTMFEEALTAHKILEGSK